MPMNYWMFNKRADQDPEARQKTGFAKMFAGRKLMLKDDKKALTGTSQDRKDLIAERRKTLREGP